MNFKKSVRNFSNNVMRSIGIQSTYQIQINLKVKSRTMGVFVINADGINEKQAQSRAEAFIKENFTVETNVLKKLSSKEAKVAKSTIETVALNN